MITTYWFSEVVLSEGAKYAHDDEPEGSADWENFRYRILVIFALFCASWQKSMKNTCNSFGNEAIMPFCILLYMRRAVGRPDSQGTDKHIRIAPATITGRLSVLLPPLGRCRQMIRCGHGQSRNLVFQLLTPIGDKVVFGLFVEELGFHKFFRCGSCSQQSWILWEV